MKHFDLSVNSILMFALNKLENRENAYVVGLRLPNGTTEEVAEADLRRAWNRMRQLEGENRRLLVEHSKDLKEIALAQASAVGKGGRVLVNKRDTIIKGTINISNSQVGSLTGDVAGMIQELRGRSDTAELGKSLSGWRRGSITRRRATPEEKSDAVEQVGVIAKSAAAPSEPALTKAARLGFGFLRSLGEKLGDTVRKLVDAAQKLFELL